MRSILVIVLFIAGCGTFQLKPRSNGLLKASIASSCKKYASRYILFGSIAAGSAALAGAGGLSTIATSDSAKIGLSISSAGLGVVGAVSTFISGYYASTWSKCSP